MTAESNPVVGGYSALASDYDSPGNLQSCWGKSTAAVLDAIQVPPASKCVVDIGCGTGHELLAVAGRTPSHVSFVGIEPAQHMRERAAARTKHLPNVKIVEGTFENIPLAPDSVDYLYSVYAFHWTTDPARSASELRRVLGSRGEMDLVFVGNNNGHEFNAVTTPIVRQYMGRAYMLTAGKMQRHISRDAALALFAEAFPGDRVSVEESHDTYYDTLDGHWAWRVRIEGHFSKIPAEKRKAFDAEVRAALQGLATDRGIPYTIHKLHVKVRN